MDNCPHCHAGALQRRLVLYAAWHSMPGEGDEQFVLVPNVPAWLCDVCGAKILDADAMARLAPLIGPAVDEDDASRTAFARQVRQVSRDLLDGDVDRGRAQ
jgi:hypothetical protein